MSYADLLKRTLVVVGVALVPVLIWYLFDVILIAFGAVILAMLLRLGAEPFVRWLRFREGVALTVSGLLILAIIGAAAYLFGTRITVELQDVLQRASSAAGQIRSAMQQSQLGNLVLSHLSGGSLSLTDLFGSILEVSSTFLESLLILVISGIYLAAQPRLYRDGLIQLFPPRLHRRAGTNLDGIAGAMRLWLIGQLIQMILIGGLSTLALWIIGVPSPLALGLIAGVAEFVPYLGPIIAAVPAVLVAFTISQQTALWTVAAYVLVHQIEGHLVIPLVQQHLVFIPPAVILLGIASISFLFGPVAMIFAAPMAVLIFVAVKALYVRDALGEKTEVPGEAA